MYISIHINPTLSHQREHAEWFQQGFLKHGIKANVTSSITQEADIHVVSGPWYAKSYWLGHPRVILLDRCFYKGDPDHVSLGWMNSNGSRSFRGGSGRVAPAAKDSPIEGGSIFLADYKGRIGDADTVRLHPADRKYQESLTQMLRRHRTAIGYSTTALVTAALEGLRVISYDKNHIINQPNWIEFLPYADWHYDEIKSGEAIKHLMDTYERNTS